MTLGRVRPALVIGCVLAVVVVGLATWVTAAVVMRGSCKVGDETVAAADVRAPFDAADAEIGDAHTQKLAATAGSWGLGEVIGSLGYDYDQHLRVAALPGHLGVWTRRESTFAVLDPDLKPVWGVKESRVRRTYDATATSFLSVTAPAKGAPEVSARALKDGAEQWCHRLDQPALGAKDPIATTSTDAAVFVLAGKAGDERLTRLDGKGDEVFAVPVSADRGDSLLAPFDGVMVAGGRPQYELSDPATSRTPVVGLDEKTGKRLWGWQVGEGVTVNVAGSLDGQVVLLEQDPASGQRLVGVDQGDGHQLWTTEVDASASPDVTVRDDVALVRTSTDLTAYDVATGKQRWSLPVRQQPQYFPYGFSLGAQPMLDDHTMLLAGTDAIHELDLATGKVVDHRLPTDGINTTWWPYQLAVVDDRIALLTNTGAVVLG